MAEKGLEDTSILDLEYYHITHETPLPPVSPHILTLISKSLKWGHPGPWGLSLPMAQPENT